MDENTAERQLVIELNGSADEPCGYVRDRAGQRMQFDGWLQLLAALHDAIGEAHAVPRPAPKRLG